MSDVKKTTLKEIQQLLKRNEYKQAIKKCKEILKKDKNNYAALILLGAGLREIEEFKVQAPLAFQKAIDLQPDNPLAWQGLIAFYNSEPVDPNELDKLIKAYCKLLRVESDSAKIFKYLDRVTDLSLRYKENVILHEIVQTLSFLRETANADISMYVNKTLAYILSEHYNKTEEFEDLFEDVLSIVVKDANVVNKQDYCKTYLKILYKRKKLKVFLTEASQMHEAFPQDIYPLEWICQIYYEESILNENYIDVDIDRFSKSLLELDAKSVAGMLARAVYLEKSGDTLKSREILNELVSLKPKLLHAWIMLTRINSKLYCWEDMENSANQALEFIDSKENNELWYKMQVKLCEAMSRSHDKSKWEIATQLCKNLLTEMPSIQLELILARTKVLLNDTEVLAELLKMESQTDMKVRYEATILRALYLKNDNRFEEAMDVLGSALKTSEAWLLLGKIYWKMADYNHSLMAFLNSIQADCYNWECLIYLGHYYYKHNNIERARKCYHTVLQIYPRSKEAGIGLSTAYRLLNNNEANMQLLQKLTNQINGPKWAWLQLGFHYLNNGDEDQAIRALQHVVRADPNDNYSWEALADAYLTRGAHTSALRSYQRALELSAESLYPKIQLANIKLVIHQLEEAKSDFECILCSEPNCILALKGLAETCLCLAKKNTINQFLGRARDNLQQATNCLKNIITEHSDLCCIWKLLGDVFYRSAKLPEKYSYLKIPSSFMKCEATDSYTIIKRTDLLLLSARFYCCALSISKDSALLWHDLACCYFSQLQSGISEDQESIASKSLAAAKHAVKLCPTSWSHWNILGVICMSPQIKNYALAQHCYVMAIDRESNNPIVLSNLGTLYLHLGDIYRANEAFSRAQRADPAYINGWIGQGIIAEKAGSREAMDLFRHSTQLGYHDEAALGYSHWVLTTLLNPTKRKDSLYKYTIVNMHAIPVATDVLNWYIERNSNNAYAYNSYGLILERQKLYQLAAEQFAESLRKSDNNTKDAISINLARVFVQLEKYTEAIELCKSIKTLNFNSQCHLALSFFKAKRYEESYVTYETALHWLADSSSEKGDVLCAMAAMAHIFQGMDDVKTLLFQCIQIQPPTISGFLAAAALGILHRDFNLTTLVLKELKQYQDHPEYRHHIAILTAYLHLFQNNANETVRILSKAIHRHPDDVNCWVSLVRTLLEMNLPVFSKCAEKALYLGRSEYTTNVIHVVCASALSSLTSKNTKDGLRFVQKVIFSFPGHIESWAIFIAALVPRCTNEHMFDMEWLKKLISINKNKFIMKPQMSQWLLKNERAIATNK